MASTSPLGRRARNKEEKRERLRQAAWELFCEVGFDVATTRAIAERAEVATGTVFVYARDKTDLLFLVFEERLSATAKDALATLPKRRSLVGRLVYVFQQLYEMYGQNPDLALRFIKQLPGERGSNADRVNAVTFWFWGEIARLLEEEKAKGTIRHDVDAAAAAQAIFGLYFMSLLMHLAGFAPPDTDFATSIRRALDLLFHGLAADPGAPPKV